MRSFDLQKTWAATGRTTTTFNATSNIAVPYGREAITVAGTGQPGNSTVPSTVASYNAQTVASYNAQTVASYNAQTVASYNAQTAATYNPSSFSGTAYTYYYWMYPGYEYSYFSAVTVSGSGPVPAYSCTNGTWDQYCTDYSSVSVTPGNIATYNAGTAATYNAQTAATYNAQTAATYNAQTAATYNAIVSGVAGTPTTVLGVAIPGGAIGTTGPTVSATAVNYWNYPDNATYPVTVPTGAQVTIAIK